MEKQDAIDFIIGEFEKNRSQAEITAELSQRLAAPPEIVAGFVGRTIASYTPVETATQLDQSPSSYTEIASTAESTGAVPDLLELQPADSPSQLPPPETIEDQLLSVSPNQSAPTWDSSALDVAAAKPLSAEEKARLEKWILSALARNPRQSDVVMMVCERTGMNWNQAQRLVAEVSTKSRKKLNARENLILIPLAILFILAGLGLVYATSNDLYTFYLAMSQPETLPAGVEVPIDRYTLIAAGIGVTMFLGGIAGLFLAIRKQSE